jgi:hypothetical protein
MTEHEDEKFSIRRLLLQDKTSHFILRSERQREMDGTRETYRERGTVREKDRAWEIGTYRDTCPYTVCMTHSTEHYRRTWNTPVAWFNFWTTEFKSVCFIRFVINRRTLCALDPRLNDVARSTAPSSLIDYWRLDVCIDNVSRATGFSHTRSPKPWDTLSFSTYVVSF